MRYYKEINGEKIFSGLYIEIDGKQVLNPTHEQMLLAGWQVYDDTPTEEEQLQMAIERKLAEIDAYNSSPEVDSFTLNGVPMWLSYDERIRIRASINSCRNKGRDTMEKVSADGVFKFPLDVWQSMIDAIDVYAGDALNTTERHKLNVKGLKSMKEVEAYDHTLGYPEKCAFKSM